MMQKRYKINDVVDGVKAAELVKKYGSPLYVYSEAILKSKI
jgi:diaminopimelate decarboxylase